MCTVLRSEAFLSLSAIVEWLLTDLEADEEEEVWNGCGAWVFERAKVESGWWQALMTCTVEQNMWCARRDCFFKKIFGQRCGLTISCSLCHFLSRHRVAVCLRASRPRARKGYVTAHPCHSSAVQSLTGRGWVSSELSSFWCPRTRDTS